MSMIPTFSGLPARPAFPYLIPPYTNGVPFTYRDGMTFLRRMEAFAHFIDKSLIPWIDEGFKTYIDEFNKSLDAIRVYMEQQQVIIDNKIGQFNELANETILKLNELAAAVEADKDAAEAARDKAEQYAATAGEMADMTVAEFIGEDASKTVTALTERYTIPYTPEMFGAKRDGVTDDTKAIQSAINAANLAGGGVVQLEAGVYAFDANKGSASAYDPNKRGGLWYDGTVNNVELVGKGKGVTTLKNVADNATMGIGIRGGKNLSWKRFTVDLDYPTRTTASLAFSSTRGEGAIYWNGTNKAVTHLWEDVEFKNTGHYGIGIQNVDCTDIKIVRASFLKIGGDAIDIKEWNANPNTGAPAYPKNAIFIDSPYADTIGLNATEDAEQQDAAAFDLRGEVTIVNPVVMNLNTFETGGAPMIGCVGVRVNGRLDSEYRLGGRNVRVIGGYVKSSKAASEGGEDVKRIIGLRVSSSDTMVTGFISDSCYIGTRITTMGNSTPQGSMVDSKALNCNIGLNIASGCNNGVINFTANNCGTSATIPGNALGNVLNFVSRAATVKDWDIPSVVYYRNMTTTYPPIIPAGYPDDDAAAVDSIPLGRMYIQGGGSSGNVRMRVK